MEVIPSLCRCSRNAGSVMMPSHASAMRRPTWTFMSSVSSPAQKLSSLLAKNPYCEAQNTSESIIICCLISRIGVIHPESTTMRITFINDLLSETLSTARRNHLRRSPIFTIRLPFVTIWTPADCRELRIEVDHGHVPPCCTEATARCRASVVSRHDFSVQTAIVWFAPLVEAVHCPFGRQLQSGGRCTAERTRGRGCRQAALGVIRRGCGVQLADRRVRLQRQSDGRCPDSPNEKVAPR